MRRSHNAKGQGQTRQSFYSSLQGPNGVTVTSRANLATLMERSANGGAAEATSLDLTAQKKFKVHSTSAEKGDQL